MPVPKSFCLMPLPSSFGLVKGSNLNLGIVLPMPGSTLTVVEAFSIISEIASWWFTTVATNRIKALDMCVR